MQFFFVILYLAGLALPILGLIYLVKIIAGKRGAEKGKIDFLKNEALRWGNLGIITKEQYDNIIKLYLSKESKKLNLVKVIMFCGAIFLGLGVLLFVSSNWDKLSNLNRTIILLTATFASLFAGYYYTEIKQTIPALGKSIIFLSTIMWGASIILIAQIYHIPSSGNWIILLLWGLPILPLAVLFKNRAVLWLSIVILAVWNFMYSYDMSAANYYYPLLALCVLLPLSKNDTAAKWLSITGLFAAAWYAPFLKYEWLALLIPAGTLAYHVISGEKKYLIASALAFPAWYVTFFVHHGALPNYYAAVPVAVLIYLAVKAKHDVSFTLALCGGMITANLLIWRVFQPQVYNYGAETYFLVCFYIMLGIALYILNGFLKGKLWEGGAKVLTFLPLVMALIGLFTISFKGMAESLRGDSIARLEYFIMAFSSAVLLFFVYAVVSGVFQGNTGKFEKTGLGLVIVSVAAVYLSLGNVPLMIIAANAALFGLTVIMLFFGKEIESPPVFNFGLFLFGAATFMRYFDVGWMLMSRSMFFLLGGLILIGLGLVFDWNRKTMLKKARRGGLRDETNNNDADSARGGQQ
ncbi:MAG: DUF2157 domain-containing protein [Elusimicrobiota bacterium]